MRNDEDRTSLAPMALTKMGPLLLVAALASRMRGFWWHPGTGQASIVIINRSSKPATRLLRSYFPTFRGDAYFKIASTLITTLSTCPSLKMKKLDHYHNCGLQAQDWQPHKAMVQSNLSDRSSSSDSRWHKPAGIVPLRPRFPEMSSVVKFQYVARFPSSLGKKPVKSLS